MERMKSEKGFIKKIRQLESKIVNSVKLMNIKYQRCDPLIFAFFDGVSGAAITMKYNQMNAELMRNKNLSDKITTLKKQLLNI